MRGIVLRLNQRSKADRHGFESVGDIIRRYEDQVIPGQFDADLSLKIDAAHLLREEMNERSTSC